MASQIDITKPVAGSPTTQSVRDNFTTAANEITALQFATLGAPFMPLAGGRMNGALYLAGDPTDAMMPATKGYVDASGGGGGGGGIPEAPADSFSYGRRNGAWVQVLNLGGGTLTGPLTLAADPTAPLQPATKQYSDLKLALAGGVMTGPLTLAVNPSTALQAVTKQYADGLPFLPIGGGTLTGALTLAGDPGAALQPATKQYTDGAVANAAFVAADNVGRNLIHNSMFRVQQRGAGPWPGGITYTADRWLLQSATDTVSINTIGLGDTARATIGDEEASFALGNVFTGNAAAAAFNMICQRIENARRLAGKTVTVSFWANATATVKLGVSIDQFFGTGGSPSTQVLGPGQSVTITPTWTRYALTFQVPSASGKAFGTNANTDYTAVDFWYSAGANFAARSGNIGVQSAQVNLWGVQCEIGPAATPLEKPDPQQEIAKTQRFYVLGTFKNDLNGVAGAATGAYQPFPVTMRAIPTVTSNFTSQVNCSGGAAISSWLYGIELYATATAAGMCAMTGSFTANADL